MFKKLNRIRTKKYNIKIEEWMCLVAVHSTARRLGANIPFCRVDDPQVTYCVQPLPAGTDIWGNPPNRRLNDTRIVCICMKYVLIESHQTIMYISYFITNRCVYFLVNIIIYFLFLN